MIEILWTKANISYSSLYNLGLKTHLVYLYKYHFDDKRSCILKNAVILTCHKHCIILYIFEVLISTYKDYTFNSITSSPVTIIDILNRKQTFVTV